jgi:hypothetical protein
VAVSRYDLFRRRLAPIAFFLAIGLLARDSCQKHQRTHATVELRFEGDVAAVRGVDVDVWVGGEIVAQFHRSALPDRPIGRCELELAVPEDDGEFRITVDRGASHQQLTRAFHAIDGSTMLVAIPEPAPR